MIYISMTTRKAYFPDDDKPDDCGAYVRHSDFIELRRELTNTQAANRDLVRMVGNVQLRGFYFGITAAVCAIAVTLLILS